MVINLIIDNEQGNNSCYILEECLYCRQPLELQTIDDNNDEYSLHCSHKDKCSYLSFLLKNRKNNLTLKEYHSLNLDFTISNV